MVELTSTIIDDVGGDPTARSLATSADTKASGAAQILDIRNSRFGAKCDGVTDDTPAVQAAVNAAIAAGGGKIYFPSRSITRLNSPVVIPASGIVFCGDFGDRASRGGSQITAYGCDAFIIGSDNGLSWDAGEGSGGYNGPQKTKFSSLCISQGIRNEPLLIPGTWGNFGLGTSGITDWRGGDVDLDDVLLEGFEWNFKGINSDINKWGKVTSLYSRWGIYAGPRTDQFHIDYIYGFGNERLITLDTVDGFTADFINCVACGSSSIDPIEVRRGTGTVHIKSLWVESLGPVMRSAIGAGCIDGYNAQTRKVSQIKVDSITFYGPESNVTAGLQSLVALGRAYVELGSFKAFRGSGHLQVTSYVLVPSDQSWGSEAVVLLRSGGLTGNSGLYSKLITNSGGGSPKVLLETDNGGSKVLGGTGVGGLTIREVTNTQDFQLAISSAGLSGTFQVQRLDQDPASGQLTRLLLRRSWQNGAAIPTSGYWQQGDIIWNNTPTIGSPIGWVCGTSGTPGSWISFGTVGGSPVVTGVYKLLSSFTTSNSLITNLTYGVSTSIKIRCEKTGSGSASNGQPPLRAKIEWNGRYNNTARGGYILIDFGSYDNGTISPTIHAFNDDNTPTTITTAGGSISPYSTAIDGSGRVEVTLLFPTNSGVSASIFAQASNNSALSSYSIMCAYNSGELVAIA